MISRRRRTVLVLALVASSAACTAGGLSDGAIVWCKANVPAVATSATLLHLPAPNGFASWREWGDLTVAAKTMNVDGWSAFLLAADLPNRDRACGAAYAAR